MNQPLTPDQTNRITAERFDEWRGKLVAENATPALAVGIGHGPKSGAIVVCVPEGLDDPRPVLELVIDRLGGPTPPPGVGPTGKFPHGRLNDSDRGELAAGLTIRGDKLVMTFGTSVTFLAMTADQAEHLARLLVERAKTLRERLAARPPAPPNEFPGAF